MKEKKLIDDNVMAEELRSRVVSTETLAGREIKSEEIESSAVVEKEQLGTNLGRSRNRGTLKAMNNNKSSDAASFQVSFNEDDEFEFVQPVCRRSTSLKTSRPTTGDRLPGPKKAVRFADALGLDLASVRHIMNSDEPPVVPRSALNDLCHADDYIERVSSASLRFMDVFQLCLCFSQPGCTSEFARRVEERRVSLESCAVQDSSRTISGVVRVANIIYEKRIAVRWTLNAWLTYSDTFATYLEGSKDGRTDSFSFSIHLPEHFGYGSRMEFSIMYEAGAETFWDSNFGVNYLVECYVKSVIPHEEDVEDDRRIGPDGRNCFY